MEMKTSIATAGQRFKVPTRPVTDIFTPKDTTIDRSKCRRTVPMRVLLLGMGRTGTVCKIERESVWTIASVFMRMATQTKAGYEDTYHMMSASVENPPDCIMWQRAFEAKYNGIGTFGREEWDSLLGHCQAVCDWPAICFAKELVEAYPEAKVILTTRNVDTWHASVMNTVYWRVKDPELKFASYFDWGAGLYHPMLTKFFATFFRDDFPNQGKDVFRAHYEEVRSLVPRDQLLEFNVAEGWGPLCEFLGEPKPLGESFPHANDAHSFVTRCRARNRAQICNAAFRYAVIGVGLYILFLVLIFLMY
ncbi:NAD dependent epimerase/dehydratase [Diplocarpon mali]|nr:NAD dependent epimerase/dehydratase [Diplocarpon mali]